MDTNDAGHEDNPRTALVTATAGRALPSGYGLAAVQVLESGWTQPVNAPGTRPPGQTMFAQCRQRKLTMTNSLGGSGEGCGHGVVHAGVAPLEPPGVLPPAPRLGRHLLPGKPGRPAPGGVLSDMASPGNLEIEEKYDVSDATPLPALADIPGVKRVGEPVLDLLDAVYFDTATLALAARQITLRRRTGGADHGWHLKLPAGVGRRQEILAPLGPAETVPEELLEHVLVYTRAEDLVPIARLTTERTTRQLHGPGGEHLADFADDRVHSVTLHPPGQQMEWREWEIELVHGSGRLLTAAVETLTATGASHSVHGSKLARALGGFFPPEPVAGTVAPRRNGPVLEVVIAYLDGQVTEMLIQDPRVRLGIPDAVHRMRSATRRIRSTLSTYHSLFTKAEASRLRRELTWLAGILGRLRDAEVMRERLRQRIRDLPKGCRAGPASGQIEHELGTAYNASHKEVLKTLVAERYYRLLDDLERFRAAPPATSRAFLPAHKETARLVNKMAKRLGRAHKTAMRAERGAARDTALHQVRKDAKRLQHAAESVTGIHGKRARALYKGARELQTILGTHQDTVMARALLNELSAAPALPKETRRIYRRIQAVERHIALASEKKYVKARTKASAVRLHR